ncbi:MAG TPA: DUF998 domain-containing protein [Aquihabitans sp.]|nr:DUF998 domain-containing protein [Aquihabitans sp.]
MSSRWLLSGPLAVAVLWVGIGAAVVRSGFDLFGPLPLSRLAGTPGGGSFGWVLMVAAVLFIVFAVAVRHASEAGWAFVGVFVTAMVGQFVAGAVPIGPPPGSDPVHVAAGLVLGAAIPVFVTMFAWQERTAVFVGLAAATVAATAAGIASSQVGVAAVARSSRRWRSTRGSSS